MDNLFMTLLALTFAQGLWTGYHPTIRALALVSLGALAVALVYSLQ